MTNNLITKETQHAIAQLKQQSQDLGFAVGLPEGVGSSYKFISVAGGKFSVVEGDKRMVLPQPLKCVILAIAKTVSKSYFQGSYVPGKDAAPACCSADGIKPDAEVTDQQAVLCAKCSQNVFGSKGNGKACTDKVRTVVMLFNDSVTNPSGVYRLDIPPDSFKNLDLFVREVQRYLGANQYCAVEAAISFDPAVATSRLLLQVTRVLGAAEIQFVAQARSTPIVSDMINMRFQPRAQDIKKVSAVEDVREVEETGSALKQLDLILEDVLQ